MADTADEAERAAESHKELQRQQREGRSASQASESDVKNLAHWQEQAAEETIGHAESTKELRRQQETMSRDAPRHQASVERTTQVHGGAAESVASHADSHMALTESAEASRGEIDKLAKSLSNADEAFRRAESGESAFGSSTSRSTQSVMKARQELTQLTQEYERYNAAVKSGVASSDAAVSRTAQGIYAQKFASVARRLPTESSEFERASQQSASARVLASSPARSVQSVQSSGDDLVRRMKELDSAAQNHSASNSALAAGYSQVASGLKKVVTGLESGSEEAKRFGGAMDDAMAKSKNIDLARAGNGFTQFAQKVASATDGAGVKIVSLSAELRGLRLVGLVGLFQPIVTGLISLGGAFINVASGAGQAAAAIGGAFISGLGQMIPMIGIAVAALSKLRAVFAAVQASQALQQANAASPYAGQITALQNASQLIDAQQQLANAYNTLKDAQVEVTESQQQLTQARIDSIRNIQDLVIAEQSAKLALAQSNLSEVQARQALGAAEASGSTQSVEEAVLGVRAARIQHETAREGVPRAKQDLGLAQRYGVAGSPEMISATQAYKQALLGVVHAQQQIADSQRQLKITELTAKEPSSHQTSQQSTLNYLLSKLSAPEKALYKQLDDIEKKLQDPNGPLAKISDYLIKPFTGAAERLNTLLSDPKFLAPIDMLAKKMGGAVKSIFHTADDKQGTGFIDTMAKDATKSVPIVTKSITGLMKLFEDIAKAAAPAFDKLSGAWAKFWGELDHKDGSPQGQAKLKKFFDQGAKWAIDFGKLATAMYDLFRAIGHDAAPQGMDMVSQATKGLKNATDWIQSHGSEVTHFFSQAKSGFGELAGTLFQIAKQLLQIFNLTSLDQFAKLLNGVVLPAAKILSQVIGFMVTEFMNLLNQIGPLKDIVIGLVGAFMGMLILSKVIGLITKATTVMGGFKDAIKAFRDADGPINKLKGAWEALTDRISKGTSAMGKAKTASDELNDSEDKGAGKGTADATAQGSVATADGAGATSGAADATAQGDLDAAESTGAGVGAADATAQTGVDGAEGVGGAEAAAGGLGAAGAIGSRLIPAAALAYLGYKAVASNTQTQTPSGLASLLGPTSQWTNGENNPSGMHMSWNFGDLLSGINPLGGHFGQVKEVPNSTSSQTSNLVKSLRSGLTGITNPAELSTSDLTKLYEQAQKLSQLPDITAKQRAGLSLLMQQLNPATAAMQKMGQQWGATFAGINSTTGNVMQQVQAALKSDIANISSNLGTGTKQGTQALAASINAALAAVANGTTAAAQQTAAGMKTINSMLNSALSALGLKGINLGTGMNALQHAAGIANISAQTGIAPIAIARGLPRGEYADGGWHPATPGGIPAQVAEGGYDEVTLTTDPAKAPRQRSLLSQFFDKAPHMAKGGNVWEVRVSAEESASGDGWTELSTNANAAKASGHAQTAIGSPGNFTGGFDFATLGREYPHGTLLKIKSMSTNRSGTFPLTDVGDGSSFAPAIGLTPAVQSALGGMPSQVEISMADGSNINLASGFGRLISGSGSFTAGKGGGESGGNAAPYIKAPQVKGIGGALGELAQSGVNKIASAAQSYLNKIYAQQAAANGTSGSGGTGGTSGGGSVDFPFTYSGKLPRPVQKALEVANAIVAAHPPYVLGGYSPNGTGAMGYDCSGLVSSILHAAGLMDGYGNTEVLETWGEPGRGKYITVGDVDRGSDSGQWPDNIHHTMLEIAGQYFESSGYGDGPHKDSGFVYPFPTWRHPKGLAVGGAIGNYGRIPPPEAKKRKSMAGRFADKAQALAYAAGGMLKGLTGNSDASDIGDPYSPVPANVQQAQRIAQMIAGRHLPYGWSGPNPHAGLKATSTGVSLNQPGYDCSGYESAVFSNSGIPGWHPGRVELAAEQINSVTEPGPGKYITVGTWGSWGDNAHTMFKINDQFFESGGPSNRGPHIDSGWSMSFDQYRHPRGYAVGGRAPWGGAPVPIIAHEGERIANPNQWGEVARLAGTTPDGLDAHLGYNTSSPKQSFASGGKPTVSSATASNIDDIGTGILNASGLSAIALKINGLLTLLAGFVGNLFKFDPGSLTTGLANLSTVLGNVTKALGDIDKLPLKDQTQQLSKLLEAFADPENQDSVLNILAAEFQRFQNNLSNWITSVGYTQKSVSPTAIASVSKNGNVTGSGYAGVRMSGPDLLGTGSVNGVSGVTVGTGNIGRTGQASIDELGVRSSAEQTTYLTKQSQEIQKAISKVVANMAKIKHSKEKSSLKSATLKKLEGAYNELTTQQENLKNAINTQITTTFQAEQTYIQDQLDQVNDVYQTQQNQIQGKQATAQTLGNYGALPQLDQALVDSTKAQMKALAKPLAEAKKQGNSDLVAQILQQIAGLKQTVAQTGAQIVSDEFSGIEQHFQTVNAKQSSKQSIAQGTGNYAALPSIDQSIADSAQAQIAALQGPLKKAKKSGNAAMVAQIEQEIAGLNATVSQSITQMVQDQLAGVEQTFATSSAALASQQGSASAMGNFSALPQIDSAIITQTQQHISSLQSVLASAQATGNTSLAAQIQQEIDQLQETVAQTTAQMIQDSMSAIQQTAATQGAQVSMLQSMSQTMQSSAGSNQGIAAAFGVNAQALNLNQSSLQSQLSGYTGLLGEAEATGNVGAVATLTQQIDALNAQIYANTQAIQDNTANMISAEAQWTQSRSQFQTGTLGGLAQIITTIGQTTGYTNVPLLQSLTSGQNTVLQGTQSTLLGQLGALGGGAAGLAQSLTGITDPGQFASILGGANLSGIESGMDAPTITAFETLISNLTSNTEAIASNNQQLATLNGQLLQPQTWSSASWTSFRAAVFTGMGNLLPAYQNLLTGTAALPTIAPTFSPVSGIANSPTIGTLNINHAPTSSLSPQLIGEQLAYEASSAL